MSSDEQKRQEKIEKIKEQYKKDMQNRPSQRPMGYIFPKRIKQVMNGENPTIQVGGFYKADMSVADRKVGEEWTDSDGKTWKKVAEGYVERVSELDDIRKELHRQKHCSKCDKPIISRLDEKFYKVRKLCSDCAIKEETHMIAAGTFDDYAKSFQIKNAMAFFQDARQQIEEYLKNNSGEQSYVNEDGTIEKWTVDETKMRDFLENELTQIDTELKNLKDQLDKLNIANK